MSRVPRPLLVGLLALLALRLVIAAHLPLGDDEAYYWDWSRHLAPGYVDHPPAIAFLIRAATALAGPTPLAVHGVAAILSFATSLAVFALAREVLGRGAAAVWSVVLFNIVPVVAGGALLAVPDAPLGLCWTLTLLWAWRAARRPDPAPARAASAAAAYPAWLAVGLWLGLAMQSKYAALVLPISVAIWLALSPAQHRWWRRPEPYAGAAVAVGVFSPVIWWNATHGWASVTFNLARRPEWAAHGNVPMFVLLEMVYAAPLMLPALLWALAVAARRGLAGEDRWLFLASGGAPMVAGMFVLSAFAQVRGHWPAPGYVTAAVALAGLAVERPWWARPPAWRAAAAAVVGSTVTVTALIYAVPALAPLLLPPRLDPTVDYDGWPEAAQQVAAAARRGARGPYFVTTDRYQIMAQFDYATGGRYVATTITGEDQYGVWTRWAALRGWDGLFIVDERYPLQVDLREGCRSLQPEPPVRVERRGRVVRTLGLVWCRGFEGRPIPRLRHFTPAAPALN